MALNLTEPNKTSSSISVLSPNKSLFLELGYFRGRQLSVPDLLALARYYKQKYNIHIYVQNHLTEQGVACEKTLKSNGDPFKEVLFIQRTLSSDARAGYLHTTDNNASHVEAFLITPQVIIRPVPSDFRSIFDSFQESLSPDEIYAQPNIAALMNGQTFAAPQTDLSCCASLSLSYLKVCLKNNGEVLRNSLIIPFYSKHNDTFLYFFLPRPEVLQYTQNEHYNETVKKLVETNELMERLRFAARKAHQLKQSRIEETCGALLERFRPFAEQWLEDYRQVMGRTALRGVYKDKERHLHLAYTSQRFKIRAALFRFELPLALTSLLTTIEALKNTEKNWQVQAIDVLREHPMDALKNTSLLALFLQQIHIKYGSDFFLQTLPVYPHIFVTTTCFESIQDGLSFLQRKDMTRHLQNPTHFMALVWQENMSLAELFKWLMLINISDDEKLQFLSSKRAWMKQALQDYITAGSFVDCTTYLSQAFREKCLDHYLNIDTDLIPLLGVALHHNKLKAISSMLSPEALSKLFQCAQSMLPPKEALSQLSGAIVEAYRRAFFILCPTEEQKSSLRKILELTEHAEREPLLKKVFADKYECVIDVYDLSDLLVWFDETNDDDYSNKRIKSY